MFMSGVPFCVATAPVTIPTKPMSMARFHMAFSTSSNHPSTSAWLTCCLKNASLRSMIVS
jgi:hypothetical protein